MNLYENKYWIVVANASKFKVFACDNNLHKPNLIFIRELTHEASRLKVHDLEDHSPGRYKTYAFGEGSTYQPKTDPREVTKYDFAKEIALLLKHAKDTNKYENLIIIAHDHFYGILKLHFDHTVQESIYMTIPKDYSFFSTEELEKAILNEVLK